MSDDLNDTNSIQVIRNLNHVYRCACNPVVKPTTVAEHSYHTTVIALFIAEEIATRVPEVFSIAEVVRQALLHDVEEAILSDIPHPVKKHIDMGEALPTLFDEHFWDAPGWLETAVLTPHGGTLEARVVKLADYLELAMHCKDEERMGNHNLDPIKETAIKLAKELNEDVKSVVALNVIRWCS